MIRVQALCFKCKQMIDCTLAARTLEELVVAFNRTHLYDECLEEESDGQAQEEPDTTENDGDEPESTGEEAAVPAKVH